MSAFILYMQSAPTEELIERLIDGDKDKSHIALPQLGNESLEQNDLIIVMENVKNNPLLVAIGKAVSDYEVSEYGKTVNIHFDFIIGEHKDFTQFSCLLKEEGFDLDKTNEDIIQLPVELTEKLIKRFAVVYMACSHPHSSFAFNPKQDKKQLLCDYLNEFCPEFRKEVIKRFPLEYKNYKQGEVIDRELIDLTYDKSVTKFPDLILDWNLLFDIVRPRA
ncbi:MAG: hypothetical protein J5631_15535 [Spirochaetaceae bacterium]|nr:hypothetical protein [Spirochaetaceae bacterium]